MYASLVMFRLGPGMRSAAEKIADQSAPALKTLKGFRGVTFLGNVTVSQYSSLSLWDSKEDAEAASAAMAPKLEQAVSSIAKEPPTRQIFEVYEPKV